MTTAQPATGVSSPSQSPPAVRFRISRFRRIAWVISLLACLLSLVGISLCWINPEIRAPLRPGLDFTGGTQIQLQRSCGDACAPLSAEGIRRTIASISLPADEAQRPPSLAGAGVQLLDGGRRLELRLPDLSAAQGQFVVRAMEADAGPFLPSATSVNTIGPTLGSRLLRSSLISLLVSFAAISAYITFTYSGVYAFLALFCLAHDVMITCGVFAWLGLLLGLEVDSLFAVALITIAGYSVNDTVVIYDRIREQKKSMAEHPLIEQVDVAVDATLTRSLYTTFTTILPLLALILFGGSSLFWFAVTLSIGFLVGSWSSIGVAPTLLPVLARR